MLSPYHRTYQFLLENVSQTVEVTEERIRHIVDAVEYTCVRHIQYQLTVIVSDYKIPSEVINDSTLLYLFYDQFVKQLSRT